MQDRDYFELQFANLQKQLETGFKNLDDKVAAVDAKVVKINGRVGKHDDQIHEALIERAQNREKQDHYFECIDEIADKISTIEKAENLHIINCPQNPTLKKITEQQKVLSDEVLTLKNLRSFRHSQMVMGISIGALAITIMSFVFEYVFTKH